MLRMPYSSTRGPIVQGRANDDELGEFFKGLNLKDFRSQVQSHGETESLRVL